MSNCSICNQPIAPFISFGDMPIANGFLTEAEFAAEKTYPLSVGLCESCGMVQLTEVVEREKMFHGQYPFFSSTSRFMQQHFGLMAEDAIGRVTSPDPFVVEVGSNDGIMLQNFAAKGIRHLGVEPSSNVAEVARQKGVNTISEFFDEDLARKIVAEYGHADLFLGANVMCHIQVLPSVLAGIKILLKPTGLLIFEDPYLGDIVQKTSYDQIYDEHVFYFCALSVQNACARAGLELVDAVPQDVHGGSMRYVIGHAGAHPVSEALEKRLAFERELQLDKPEAYIRFRKNVEQSRENLMTVLNDLRSRGISVAGYAATSKSTTVINYCGITKDHLAYICDTTPMKQGKFSPGAHIPIRPHEDFKNSPPPYALLFGWNHAREILANEQVYRDGGGKFILYVPEVHTL